MSETGWMYSMNGWTSNLPNTVILSKKTFTSMIPYIKNKCLLLPLWATNAGESGLVWDEFGCGANNFALPYAESLHISSIFRQNLKLRSGCSCSNVRLCCFVCSMSFGPQDAQKKTLIQISWNCGSLELTFSKFPPNKE